MSVRSEAIGAVRWTAVAAAARALLQFLQLAVLSRLLAPSDYGLMAMVSVVLNIAMLFVDFGINSAYVQRRDVTELQRSTLFWLNTIMGATAALVTVVLSPLLSSFFGDERLTRLIQWSSLIFLIGSLGQQLRMTAEKQLLFRQVVLLEVFAGVGGFMAAVTVALRGGGVYSLVVASLVTTLITTVSAWLFLARGWRPQWRLDLSEARSFLGFGGAMVGNGLVNQINLSIDLLLGGRLLPAAQLGLYSLPRSLVLQMQFLINPIITRVGFPLIAQLQHDIPRVRTVYLKTLRMTSSVNAPMYIGIAAFSREIVSLLLGDAWNQSIGLLCTLAIWGFFRSTLNPVGSLLTGMGRAHLSLIWNVGMTLTILPILWFGARYGAQGLSWGLVVFSLVIIVPSWVVLVRPTCGAGLVEYMDACLRPLWITLVSVAPAWLLSRFVAVDFVRLLLALLISVPLYLCISWWFNREWVGAMRSLVTGKSLGAT